MLSCAPVEIAATINFIHSLTHEQFVKWVDFLTDKGVKRVYVHWPTLTNWLKDLTLHNNVFVKEIVELWEIDFLVQIPFEGDAELPAIVYLNNHVHPDNVRVYCGTFGEYVELRKTFGKEDVKY